MKKRLICIMGVLIISSGWATTAAPPAPVYTGTLYHQKLKKFQLARLQLLSAVRPPKTGTTPTTEYSAILSLHWGSFADPEYIALYYESVRYNPQTKEFLLIPIPIAGSEGVGKLPTVRLKFSDSQTVEGEFISPTAGSVGSLKLKMGWDLLPSEVGAQFMSPLAGVYEGSCPDVKFGKSRLTSLQLVPTRLSFKGLSGSEAATNTINYVGNATCDFSFDGIGGFGGGTDRLLCGSFHPGVYDFYRNEIRLRDQKNIIWKCQRGSENELTCESDWVRNCKLTRKTNAVIEEKTPQPFALPSPAETVEAGPPMVPSACGAWDGNYVGILNHSTSNRAQYVRLSLTTLLLAGPLPPVKCSLQGTAELVFGEDQNGRERINFVLPAVEYLPDRTEQILFGEQDTDLILQMSHTGGGIIEGNWFSKLRGMVGSFSVSSIGKAPSLGRPPVSGLSAKYRRDNDPGWTLELEAIPGASDAKSMNPYRQLQISGLEWFTPGPITVGAVAYDYFTNSFVYETRGRYLAGQVSSQGLRLEAVGKTMMGIPTAGDIYVWQRQ